MRQDLRYAIRVLLQGKAWSAMVVLSLALGIGANTALFSATNGLLLRTVPVDDPASLVRLRHIGRNHMANNTSEYGGSRSPSGEPIGSTFPYPLYLELRKANQTLVDLAAGAPMGSLNVVVDGSAEIASGYLVSGNYHALLAVRALRGRTLTPDDDRTDAPPVAVISEQYWDRRFGREDAVIGKVVTVNDTPLTVVGVTPAAFTGVQRVIATAPDIVLPLVLDRTLSPATPVLTGGQPESRLDQTTHWWLQVFGRLNAGHTIAQVDGNLGGVFQEAARAGMASFLSSLSESQRRTSANTNRSDVPRLAASSAAYGLYDSDPTTMRGVAVISAVVGLILLLVCANVANLLLSRAAARQKEITVRLSIGATRLRLVRQLLTESLLLALTGGALGLVVAYWGRQLLPGTTGQAPLDWRVLLFATAIALTTGVLFGIAPALRVTRVSAGDVLKDTSRTVIGSRTWLTRTLLVTQVAISLVLLVGAGLFLRTVYNLRSVDVGFNPDNLVVFRINPVLNRYDPPRIAALYAQIVERLRAQPSVGAVTLTNPPLLAGSTSSTSFIVQGRPVVASALRDPQTQAALSINRLRIAPNFFATMEIPLLHGRQFTDRDNAPTAVVAIINEAAVRKFFPNDDPIGQRFGHSPETSGQFEIVGVVRDAKYTDLREPSPPTLYTPYAQAAVGAMAFVIRTTGDPVAAMPAIREVARQVDANVPILDMSTQAEHIERRYTQERVFAQAYTLFGVLALLVAAIGLFGLMSYNVTRRTTEIGIRMALGAQRATVLQMVLRESLALVASGVAIGVAVAYGAGRFIASFLFGLEPTDAMAMVGAVVAMVLVSAGAGYLPARRAARLDPMVALRHE